VIFTLSGGGGDGSLGMNQNIPEKEIESNVEIACKSSVIILN